MLIRNIFTVVSFLIFAVGSVAYAEDIKVYQVSNSESSSDWAINVDVRCESGDVVVGGGCEDSGEAGERWAIYTTAPSSSSKWSCRGKRDPDTSKRALAAKAICMKIPAEKK